MATREQLDRLRQRIRHTARLIYRDLGRDAGPAEQRTVRAMDDDGIHWTRPDGSEGRTAWPLPWECSIIGETLTFYVPGSDVASFSLTFPRGQAEPGQEADYRFDVTIEAVATVGAASPAEARSEIGRLIGEHLDLGVEWLGHIAIPHGVIHAVPSPIDPEE